MAKTTKEIPIFFAVDDGYSPFLAVAIQSLIDNASAEYTYLIKILNTDISEENKRKIGKYERENVDIEFVDLNYYIQKVKDKLRICIPSMTRCFIWTAILLFWTILQSFTIRIWEIIWWRQPRMM